MADKHSKDDLSHEEHMEAAKSALGFSLFYMALAAAFWGYVYFILLERGMVQ